MRWTDRDVDQLDRSQQIVALNAVLNFVGTMDQSVNRCKIAEQRLGNMLATTEKMKKGFSPKVLAGCSFALLFVLSIFTGFQAAVIITAMCLVGYGIADKMHFSKIREMKATEFYNASFPSMSQEKAMAEEELSAIQNSDDLYNARMLLPDDYLSADKLQPLIVLLDQRRARTIHEAIMLYEQSVHQKKMEAIELETLRVAKETAETQKKSAEIAESTEKLTRQIAERQEAEQARAAAAAEAEAKRRAKLVKCPACKMEISPNANVCPYCREVPAEWAPFGLWPPLF